jgi:hypothetical protein
MQIRRMLLYKDTKDYQACSSILMSIDLRVLAILLYRTSPLMMKYPSCIIHVNIFSTNLTIAF